MNFLIRRFRDYTRKRKQKKFIESLQSLAPQKLSYSSDKDYVTFSHIGLLGDIIYSIPCMLALANEKKIKLYLDITQESGYDKELKHYNNGKMLTEASVSFLRPLLLNHPQITNCEVLKNEQIDYDLNDFRKYPFDYRMGHICRWYFLTFGVNFDLSKPWAFAKPNGTVSGYVLLSRTFRYRTPLIDYSFLKKIDKIGFIGLEDEYEDMKTYIPHLEHFAVSDALQMASLISGCKLFIGNQSFPFAIAEALKVKRVLEVNFENPNVIVDGQNGFDFCYQRQFEKIINFTLAQH